jgi:hypothetical protein
MQSNFGGSQKQIGSILSPTATSNDILSNTGNGPKLMLPKLGTLQKLTQSNFGGSQKQIGSILSPTATSNDILSNTGNGAKLIGAKLGTGQKLMH